MRKFLNSLLAALAVMAGLTWAPLPKANAASPSFATSTLTLKNAVTETASTNGSSFSTLFNSNVVVAGASAFARMAELLVDCTAESGTNPTLSVSLQGRQSSSDDWTTLPSVQTFTTLSAATGTVAVQYLGPIPNYVRAVSTIGGTTPSFTYTAKLLIGG